MTQKPQVKKPIDKIKTKGESNYKQKEKKNYYQILHKVHELEER